MSYVLAIGCHPDDIEIGCGGTLALLHQRGYKIIFVVVTSGERGSKTMAKDELSVLREHEAMASAAILGVNEVVFLREPDGLSAASQKAKFELISLIRQSAPQIIFTHARSDQFADHGVVFELTMAACVAAGGPWYSEVSGKPHAVPNIYGYEVWNPISHVQMSVDVSQTLEVKLQALRQHRSQITEVNYVDAVRGLARYRGVMTMAGDYVEAFEVEASRALI